MSIMYDFSIDVQGENDGNDEDCVAQISLTEKNTVVINDNEDLNLKDKLPELPTRIKQSKKTNKAINLTDTYLITNYKSTKVNISDDPNITKIMKKSSLKPGLEKEHSLPLIRDKVAKLMRRREREKTKGENWFNLPATEVTEDIKNDLQILKMRSVLEKNHFYKKNDLKNISKYFQIGTVVENAADFYSGRIVKSQRKKTLVDELLADAECKNYQKRKYKEIMDTNRRKSRQKIFSKSNKKQKGKV